MVTRDTTHKRNTIDLRRTDIREQKIVPPSRFECIGTVGHRFDGMTLAKQHLCEKFTHGFIIFGD